MRNSHKLKGSHTYINEDLSELTNQKRKEKLQEMKNARSAGKIAYFVKDKLIIKDRKNQHTSTTPRRVTSLVEMFTSHTPAHQDNNSAMRNSSIEDSRPTTSPSRRITRSQLL